MQIGFRLLVIALFSSFPFAASAGVVTWSLLDVDFLDGTAASGSFDWDAETNTVVDWNVAISNGSDPDFPAGSFDPGNSSVSHGTPSTFLVDVIFTSETIEMGGVGLALRLGVGDLDVLDTPLETLPLVQTPLTWSGGALLCYNCLPALLGRGSLTAGPPPEPEACEVAMSQATYTLGETLEITAARYVNPTDDPLRTRVRLQLLYGDVLLRDLVDVGAGADFALPAGFDSTFGPVPLFAVPGSAPLGTWSARCALEDPVSGTIQAESVAPFEVE